MVLSGGAADDLGQVELASNKIKKRFQCQHCQRRFARLEHLQRHERIHTQDKPFSCQQCDSHFSRSDLLIRHLRLTHEKDALRATGNDQNDGENHPGATGRAKKRRRVTFNSEENRQTVAGASPDKSLDFDLDTMSPSGIVFDAPLSVSQNNGYSLATLSMAAEYSALQGAFGQPSNETPEASPEMPPPNESDPLVNQFDTAPNYGLGFEESLDNLAAFLDSEPLSSYNFSTLMSAGQPMVLFSPESFTYVDDMAPVSGRQHLSAFGQNRHIEEPNSFSRFGSRLPSLQPEESPAQDPLAPTGRALAEVSPADRQIIVAKLSEFSSAISADFVLPSRLALSRYIAAYVNGFHEHLPFLHIPTMSIEHCSIELVLAMAAVGAQYCFEGEKGVELFNASQAIASFRIRRRDADLCKPIRQSNQGLAVEPPSSEQGFSTTSSARTASISGPLGLPTDAETSPPFSSQQTDLIQTAQALLLLMAMATWAKHREILREALAIQSVLATLIRDDGLKSQHLPIGASWEEWIRFESTKRTKFIVFCFFNLHCIVYNIPPLILNSEVKLTLPSTAAEFKAPSATAWKELRKKSTPEIGFQEALRRLFSRSGREVAESNSSLGNYILIHALVQQIFFVRQIANCRYDSAGDFTQEEFSSLEHALRNWQLGWKRTPESSLDPMDPNGPVAFNSTAILRLAYIRLNIDTGPYRSLDTRDPIQIANAFRESPDIKRTPKLVRAVLHSAHALSIPVKIGIRLVSKTQTFIWSIQHSLCSLECAFLLSKWLEALSLPNPEPPITDDEWRISSLVKTMLNETEFAVPSDIPTDSPAMMKHLSAGVLRVWATIFRGAQTWAIVDVIGSSLNIYADMLEPGLSPV
ncbi:zinc finger protein ADR1 [Rhexocercosporidium sp. MPI-PUGE-AT-0058]|nr:zinc finger protein ADR1 [Rhexocercosporidium sp. MPI-PUGE-AT-0058]